jgi:hypothetical protein
MKNFFMRGRLDLVKLMKRPRESKHSILKNIVRSLQGRLPALKKDVVIAFGSPSSR